MWLKTLVEKCQETFKEDMVDFIPYKKINEKYHNKLGDIFETKIDLCSKSKSTFCVCVETKNYEIDEAESTEHIKYLISHHMKSNPTFCMNKTIYFLVTTLIIILILAFSVDMLSHSNHKKIIFFALTIIPAITINYMLIMSFYKDLSSESFKNGKIVTYVYSSEKKDSRMLLAYSKNKLDFGKLFPFYISAYLLTISTFIFYCSSLMYIGG